MKKSVFLVMMVILLIPVFSFGGSQKEDMAGPITIAVWDWQNADNYLQAFEKIFDLYNAEHPNIQFEHEVMASMDYQEALKAAIAGDELPPIFEVWTGMQLTEYHEICLDLTDRIMGDPEWKEWIGQAAGKYEVSVEGRTYLLPIDKWDVGIYCNNKILSDYGFDLPETIFDLIEMVPAMDPDGIKPMSSNFKDIWTAQFIFTVFTHQLEKEGEDLQLAAENGEVNWNNPVFRKAGEGLKEMWDNGVFRIDAFARAYNVDGIAEFTESKSMSLWAGGDWYAQTVVDAGIDATPLPFPLVEENANPTYLASIGLAYATSPNAPHLEEILGFMKFLSSPEATTIFAEHAIHPAAKIPASAKFDNPILNQLMESVPKHKEANPWIYNPEVAKAVNDGLANYILGAQTLDEFLDSINKIAQSN
jgi:raffinose/stachyose/melibiose transport system substrate-binding protein